MNRRKVKKIKKPLKIYILSGFEVARTRFELVTSGL